MRHRPLALVILASIAAIAPATLSAQSLKDRIKRRAQESVGRRVDKAVDCAMGDTKCAEKAKAEGAKEDGAKSGDEATTSASADAASSNDVPSAAPSASGAAVDALKPGEGAWANYDFKPGERILYADDFTKDEVGDFPRSLEFKEGTMEVVEWKGGRWLRATGGDNQFVINLPETLPERFTLEFDYANRHGIGWGGLLIGFNGTDAYHESGSNRFRCNHDNSGLDGSGDNLPKAMKAPAGDLDEQVFRCRLMVDGSYAKAYVNESRVANVPNAKIGRSKAIYFTVYTRDAEKHPALLGNIRVAAGGKKLYDAIAEKGRVATQGIYFDTGSDRIRPESTPTLKEISAMLGEHPELRLAIEGHTDNVGNAAANQALSEKRAAAVVRYLVEQGTDAGRLSAKGLGASKPAGSNETPSGRQANRRVELAKL